MVWVRGKLDVAGELTCSGLGGSRVLTRLNCLSLLDGLRDAGMAGSLDRRERLPSWREVVRLS